MKFLRLYLLLALLPLAALAQPIIRNSATTNYPMQFEKLLSTSTSPIFFVGHIDLDGTVYEATKGTFNNNYFFFDNVTVTNGFTNQTLTASTLKKTDANKGEASIANGGANTFLEGTTPPAFRALTQSDIPVIVTNANNSVSIIPFQWGVLVTNNNAVMNNGILAGGTLSASGINWAVLFMTNTSASTKTLLIPASVAVSGTALGSTTTAFCTNAGILTVWAIANTITGAVWRSYP
jgi:hypothetical protein